MKLTNKQKQEFQAKVQKIDEKDVKEVKSKIDKEIDSLKEKNIKKKSLKLEELIINAELLNEILKNEEFPISDSSRKWIVFGLKYLVSDIDLIPDDIPIIGYKDDSLLISWVINMLDEDIVRYKKLRQLKSCTDINKLLKSFKVVDQQNINQKVLVLPGFIYNSYDTDEMLQKFIYNLGNTDKYKNSEVILFNWQYDHLTEFMKTIKLVDHQLKLKPVFDNIQFELEYKQAKLENKIIGKMLCDFIAKYKDKDISIIAFDISAQSFCDSNFSLSKRYNLYLFGGIQDNNVNHFKKLSEKFNIKNYYSKNDNALKFIHDNFDIESNFCGLNQIQAVGEYDLKNIDLSEDLDSHFEYRYYSLEMIDK